MDKIDEVRNRPQATTTTMGSIVIIDNKELNWTDEYGTPGELCLSCCHYGIYNHTTPVGTEDVEGIPYYIAPPVVIGFCTLLIPQGFMIANVPQTGGCEYHEQRKEQFSDDVLSDDAVGGEV
jgi:hypothetical protein